MEKKSLLFMMLCIVSYGLVQAKSAKNNTHNMCSSTKCHIDKTCQCYCSVLCGLREQDDEDRPVFANKDADGKPVPEMCYCKPNDLNEYNRQCSPKASQKVMNRRQARRVKRRTKQSTTVQSN